MSDAIDFHGYQSLILPEDQVHVWFISLSSLSTCIDRLWGYLSDDEKERAARFRFDRDRDRYIAARGILRQLLGNYLGCKPGQFCFQYGEHGKPELVKSCNENRMRFSLSHSEGYAAMGFCRGREIGIDLEAIRPVTDRDHLADRFFSPAERREFQSLPECHKTQAFFNCWTRKEAYLKALGWGLALPLDSFDVSLRPGDPAQLLKVNGSPDEAKQWELHEIILGKGIAAALAVRGHNLQIRMHHCTRSGLVSDNYLNKDLSDSYRLMTASKNSADIAQQHGQALVDSQPPSAVAREQAAEGTW
jgi:4'-phosphopantetheinyl transferase